ncbi:choice-of-anchor I family protein [Paenibacillus shunpengii]|uniref:Choice-of-anchor I family protein n=1 Tax=Paenibacillus shunpengii TaxID=2054424 RepID=A0ABW5SHF5_9BACL
MRIKARRYITMLLAAGLTLGMVPAGPADVDAASNSAAPAVANAAHGLNALQISKIGSYEVGVTNADGGIAEIVRYNKDNGSFYLVNGATQPPSLDIVKLEEDGKTRKVNSINIEALAAAGDFEVGDLTSVDVNTAGTYVAVAVQEKASMKAGKVLVLDYDGKLLREYTVGVQPDMIKISPDGRYILTADEGEPRDGIGADPKGSVTIIDTRTNEVKQVLFNDPSVIGDDVHIRGDVNEDGIIASIGTKAKAETDFEPEYIALSDDNKTAYVALQENNAIAAIDLAEAKVVSVQGLGAKDLSKPGNEADLISDGQVKLENAPLKSLYMPDGIASYTINGQTYLFTANEGDATGWEGLENELKISDIKEDDKLSSSLSEWLGQTEDYDDVRVISEMGLKNDVYEELYLYGGRSFSIWNADTMEQVYDSGSDFERITGEVNPEFFNVSNDDEEMDDRSPKKGPEPEYVTVGEVGDKLYAFTGLERTGGVMVYDVTNPEKPVFTSYVNTRKYAQEDILATDTGPEGLEFIPAADSPTGSPLLLVANEVGGTVTILEMNTEVETNPGELPEDNTPGEAPSFTDLDGHWAAHGITELAASGIIHGITSEQFAPNKSVTRAQFASMLVSALDLTPVSSEASSFTDVASNAWYADDVQAAVENNLIFGRTSSSFDPSAPVTRAEMVVMVNRAARLVDASEEGAISILSKYKDFADVQEWAKESFANLVHSGMIKGDQAGRLNPSAHTSRAEAAEVLYRLLSKAGTIE